MRIGKYLLCIALFGGLAYSVIGLHVEQVRAGYRVKQKEAALRQGREEVRRLELRREIALREEVLSARAAKHGIELVPLVLIPESK